MSHPAPYDDLPSDLRRLFAGDTLPGVLDLDSPEPRRFTPADASGLEAVACWVAACA